MISMNHGLHIGKIAITTLRKGCDRYIQDRICCHEVIVPWAPAGFFSLPNTMPAFLERLVLPTHGFGWFKSVAEGKFNFNRGPPANRYAKIFISKLTLALLPSYQHRYGHSVTCQNPTKTISLTAWNLIKKQDHDKVISFALPLVSLISV